MTRLADQNAAAPARAGTHHPVPADMVGLRLRVPDGGTSSMSMTNSHGPDALPGLRPASCGQILMTAGCLRRHTRRPGPPVPRAAFPSPSGLNLTQALQPATLPQVPCRARHSGPSHRARVLTGKSLTSLWRRLDASPWTENRWTSELTLTPQDLTRQVPASSWICVQQTASQYPALFDFRGIEWTSSTHQETR